MTKSKMLCEAVVYVLLLYGYIVLHVYCSSVVRLRQVDSHCSLWSNLSSLTAYVQTLYCISSHSPPLPPNHPTLRQVVEKVLCFPSSSHYKGLDWIRQVFLYCVFKLDFHFEFCILEICLDFCAQTATGTDFIFH